MGSLKHAFSLSIDLGNDAMRSPDDVALALERIANILRTRGGEWDTTPARRRDSGTIRDSNGNHVGDWSYTWTAPLSRK